MSSTSSSNSSTLNYLQIPHACLSIFTALFLVDVLLLPLFVSVLYVSYRRWRGRRSAAKSDVWSHSDIFTIHMVAIELMKLLGSFFYCVGTYASKPNVVLVGYVLWAISSSGPAMFHLLTCVERYLAVVHPVTYRGLRQAGGVRIRNMCLGCVWLISFGCLGLTQFDFAQVLLNLLFLLFTFLVVCFCSLSVLCILIRPGPGEVAGKRGRVDKSKYRAFQTITAILVSLFLKFIAKVVFIMTYHKTVINGSDGCVVTWSLTWLAIPSSVVLPLLFLQRAGRLPACKWTP